MASDHNDPPEHRPYGSEQLPTDMGGGPNPWDVPDAEGIRPSDRVAGTINDGS